MRHLNRFSRNHSNQVAYWSEKVQSNPFVSRCGTAPLVTTNDIVRYDLGRDCLLYGGARSMTSADDTTRGDVAEIHLYRSGFLAVCSFIHGPENIRGLWIDRLMRYHRNRFTHPNGFKLLGKKAVWGWASMLVGTGESSHAICMGCCFVCVSFLMRNRNRHNHSANGQ